MGVLLFCCSGVLVFWCSGVLVFWCSGVLLLIGRYTIDDATGKWRWFATSAAGAEQANETLVLEGIDVPAGGSRKYTVWRRHNLPSTLFSPQSALNLSLAVHLVRNKTGTGIVSLFILCSPLVLGLYCGWVQMGIGP